MKKLVVLSLCLMMTLLARSQSWRSNANALVVNQIFANVVGHGDIYTFPEMLTSTDTVFLADGTFVQVPYSNCYGYFVDPQPFAHWAHSCMYCFVNASYNHVIVSADMPPVCDNLDSLSMCPRSNPTSSLPFAFDPTFTREIPSNNDPNHLWAVLICGTECEREMDHLPDYWFDLSCVYTVLTDVFGYQESDATGFNSHVIVTAPTGIRNRYLHHYLQETSFLNGSPSMYGDFFNSSEYNQTDHSKNNIHNIFKCFAGDEQTLHDYSDLGLRKLTEEDQLFIFVTGHGNRKNGRSGFYVHQDNGQYEWINDETFVGWLQGIRCSQMTLLMEPCFSGGFIDEFLNDVSNPNCLCKNRIGQSATSATAPSYAEGYKVYSHSPNITFSNDVSEFVYYWASAALGYYPYLHVDIDNDSVDAGPWMRPVGRGVGDGTMDWETYFGHYYEIIKPHSVYDVYPDTDGDGILSLHEMFEFANNLDTWSEQGYYNPRHQEPGYQPEDPLQKYESSFTKEAATLIGFEGQIDGVVNSGTPHQPYRLCGDIWVGSKAALTMCDEVQSPEGVKIYVKPQGRLILDGGRLRNLPETGSGMWQGVQVWGDTLSHQFLVNGGYAQGYLEMKNDAVIENANYAVLLWRPHHFEATGGIIHATDATFRNNGGAVRALCYTNHIPNTNVPTSYNSFFKNCTFVIDTAYIGTTTFGKHVGLTEVKGISFEGCSFSVNRLVLGISPSCCGIIADQASVQVGAYCTSSLINPCPDNSLVRSSFTGFHAGIYATCDGSGLEGISVRNTDFYNNERGIYALNAHYATILFSNFNIGNNAAECAFGIYADHISSFCIEENTFCPMPNTTCLTYGIGVVSSYSSNEIHRNKFSGLTCANVAVGQNFQYTPSVLGSGLTYSCNDNSSGSANQIDFCVLEGINAINTGIQQMQGSASLPAGNTFGGSQYHFYNDGDYIINYYYNQNQSDEIPNPTKISYVARYGTTNANSCLSHYENGTVQRSEQEKAQLASEYLAAHSAYNSLKQIYDSRIDGGNTPAELADITNATPSDMWQLRAQLLGHSPYLSQEVLTTAADRDDVFNNSVLFEILSANPDELKKDTLISYLESKDNPLPDYMIGLLRQIANGATARTALEAEMAKYCHDFRLAAGDIVRSNLNDSVANPTELRTWLAAMEDIAADRLIVASYMEEGNYTDAFTLANMLPDLYGLEGDGLADHTDYMRLLDLYRTLGTTGRTVFEMTEEETEMVEGIADYGKGTSQAMAEALLSGVMDDRGDRAYFCPDLPKPKRGETGRNDYSGVLMNEALGFRASVSPSPATTWTTVDYTLPAGATKAVMTLTTTMGVKVMEVELNGNQGSKVLDLRGLAAGVYVYSIRCGEHVQTGKLVITN